MACVWFSIQHQINQLIHSPNTMSMVTFQPFYPPRPTSVITLMRIGSTTCFVWVMAIAIDHPIVTNNEPFEIILPNAAQPVQAQLGAIYRFDATHIVYHLHAAGSGCPRFVILACVPSALPDGFVWLIPTPYTDPAMTFVYLG